MKIKILKFITFSLAISVTFIFLIIIGNVKFKKSLRLNNLTLSQTENNSKINNNNFNQGEIAFNKKKINMTLNNNNLLPDEEATPPNQIRINGQKYNISNLSDRELSIISESITTSELKIIQDTVLSSSESEYKRHSYLYFLTQLKEIGAKNPYEIIKADLPYFEHQSDPHSLDANRMTIEYSLRIAALEALDNLTIESPQIKSLIETLNTNVSHTESGMNTLLSYLMNISHAGIQGENPGKLHRVLDAVISENEVR